MSRIDPECFPQPSGDGSPVCAECFEDGDLQALIVDYDGPPGCEFCGEDDAPTMPVDEVAAHIGGRLATFYGKAVDQLPYIGREGGYQGWNVDTYDLLMDEVGLGLARNGSDDLLADIVAEIGDDQWCEYDWLILEPDESLRFSWASFCEIVKTQRRFFFHNVGADQRGGPDERSPGQFLAELTSHIGERGLIREEPAGCRMFRARVRQPGQRHTTPASLGPPPTEYATQSNRMNPPGIPMFYGADGAALATSEIRAASASVGEFGTLRPLRMLDLVDLPPVPGFFSDADRMDIMVLGFLREFARMIIQPVERNDRTQIEYIPTQVFTEFLRDFPFEDGPIDGIKYQSATGMPGVNYVLFAGPEDVEDAAPVKEFGQGAPFLRLLNVEHVEID